MDRREGRNWEILTDVVNSLLIGGFIYKDSGGWKLTSGSSGTTDTGITGTFPPGSCGGGGGGIPGPPGIAGPQGLPGPQGPPGTSPGSPESGGPDPITAIYPLFVPVGVDDEFNDGVFSGWTLVDDGTNQARVTETNNVCSLLLPGGDAAAHLHAWMKATAVGVNDVIEMTFRGFGQNQNFNVCGLIMANGATYGGGTQLLWYFSPAENNIARNLTTGYNTNGVPVGYSVTGENASGDRFLRLRYQGSNTWRGYASADGISWVDVTGAFTAAMTPTHVGFFATTWGGIQAHNWSIRYFRKGAISGPPPIIDLPYILPVTARNSFDGSYSLRLTISGLGAVIYLYFTNSPSPFDPITPGPTAIYMSISAIQYTALEAAMTFPYPNVTFTATALAAGGFYTGTASAVP